MGFLPSAPAQEEFSLFFFFFQIEIHAFGYTFTYTLNHVPIYIDVNTKTQALGIPSMGKTHDFTFLYSEFLGFLKFKNIKA